ncbi:MULTISPECIES: coiled-coil domain-containing protein [Streptomyces]|uniref:hypothetical protein n=1 Tax=Streptomyces TaxID=1883 RepID=UPI000A8DD231|nr:MULTISPECIES: hypothetical protein [Streptomyces]
MTGISIRHLTFLGPEQNASSVEFVSGLTVISGKSDTGKTYVVKSIDYMLGAKELTKIREAAGYTHALLGLKLPDNRIVTLIRELPGSKVFLCEGDVRSIPKSGKALVLSAVHSKNARSSISSYLLEALRMSGLQVVKNAKNAKNSLTFRYVAKLCIVGEQQMLSENSPTTPSGQRTERTVEKSAFRVMLSGHDDSNVASQEEVTASKVRLGKHELLSGMISDLQKRISGTSAAALTEQRERLNSSIQRESQSVRSLVERRDIELGKLRALSSDIERNTARRSEIAELSARFNLLRDQYDSDLARLEMVKEAGNLLGFFSRGDCPYCGAPPENQTADHVVQESDDFYDAISAEQVKTRQLKSDLLLTLEDMQAQDEEIRRDTSEMRDIRRRVDMEISRIEHEMEPVEGSLAELVEARSKVDKQFSLLDQVEGLLEMRKGLGPIQQSTAVQSSPELGPEDAEDFIRTMRRILDAWSAPEAETVDLEADLSDLIIGGMPRAARGMGMRGILQAAFTVALAEVCIRSGKPHPGFVILDSPVLTYRGAEPDPDDEDERLHEDVAARFYRYLNNEFPGQAIVVENIDPPVSLTGLRRYQFTKDPRRGRYGLFPPRLGSANASESTSDGGRETSR